MVIVLRIGIVLAMTCVSVGARADGPTPMLDSAREQHRKTLAGTLDLTEAQSKTFWPIFESYEKEMNAEFDRVAEVAYRVYEHSGPAPDALVDEYTESLLRSDARQAAINLAYQNRFRKILDPKKTARLFQFERRFRSAITLELANEMPDLK